MERVRFIRIPDQVCPLCRRMSEDALTVLVFARGDVQGFRFSHGERRRHTWTQSWEETEAAG
jgi:hypothetical protein